MDLRTLEFMCPPPHKPENPSPYIFRAISSGQMATAAVETKAPAPTRFQQLVKQHEIKVDVAASLFKMLSNTELVLVCDDSGSMAEQIKVYLFLRYLSHIGFLGRRLQEPNSNKVSTRWMELKRLAAVVIEYCTACNPNGMDLYFLNRGIIRGITSPAGLQEPFSTPPAGDTRLLSTLRQIYDDKVFHLLVFFCLWQSALSSATWAGAVASC